MTSFYSCDFRPVIASDCDHPATARALGRAVAEHFAGYPILGFDSLDTSAPVVEPFLAGLSRRGRATLRYAHFGRWWEDVSGHSFETYMQARAGALREVVRRKGAKLARADATFRMIGPDDDDGAVERAIAAYESVYAASWKTPEPFANFQPTLIRKLAGAGWLRLAICSIGEKPIAAQLWASVDGTATVLKLAHDQAFDRLSPGTVLTHFAIRRLMETETVRKLDFGRGDDPYKSAWTSNRTPHMGVLCVSILRRPDLIARHWLGKAKRGIRG